MDYQLKKVVDFIIASQQPDGGFPTYEYFPVWKPQEGWTPLPDSSPFITSNILYSLLQLNDKSLKPVIENGCRYLLANMEYGGYFRFWPYKSKQHPIPLDMDDTAVSSYVLEQCGHTINNKNALLACVNSKGYFYTWLQPTWRVLVANPVAAINFLKACIHGLPTRLVKHYYYTDTEPGVAANGLLYLKQSKQTLLSINGIVDEVERGEFNLKFYDDELVVYYHIARAYKQSVPNFDVLRTIIAERIKKRFSNNAETASELLYAMAANTLLDFNVEVKLAESLVQRILGSKVFPDKWEPQTYFCSRDRNFLAGSAQYTAVVYAEACSKLLRLNNNN